MHHSFNVLWLNASPSLKHFDRPLLRYLSQYCAIAQWEYRQTQDEASCLEKAVVLLHDYLKGRDRPVHLAGHGMGAVLSLTYAKRYPNRVRSLALLAVSAQPATTWQAHYYVQRQTMPCSREQLLAFTVRSLFGSYPPFPVRDLVNALRRDLEESPSMHSLFKLGKLPKGGTSMPLMITGSTTDPVVAPPALQEWQNWLKPNDKLWECPDGRHFFHYFYPTQVGEQMLNFWQCHAQLQADSLVTSVTPDY